MTPAATPPSSSSASASEGACTREDHLADTGTPGGQLTLVDGTGDPLRGEQPKSPTPTTDHHDHDPAVCVHRPAARTCPYDDC
jgi:hypothetical protein